MVWAVNIKVGRDTVHGKSSECIDHEFKRSRCRFSKGLGLGRVRQRGSSYLCSKNRPIRTLCVWQMINWLWLGVDVALQKHLGITGMHREVGSLMHRRQHNDPQQLCDYLLAQSCTGTVFSFFYCELTVVTILHILIFNQFAHLWHFFASITRPEGCWRHFIFDLPVCLCMRTCVPGRGISDRHLLATATGNEHFSSQPWSKAVCVIGLFLPVYCINKTGFSFFLL